MGGRVWDIREIVQSSVFNQDNYERKANSSGADSIWLSQFEEKGFLCVVGLPRSCDFLISFHIKFILIMAHHMAHTFR